MDFPSPLLPFDHPAVLQTALPLGGIGAGCICLNGYGGSAGLSRLRHRPCVTGLPDRHNGRAEPPSPPCALAGAKPIARLLEGPLPPEKVYNGAAHAGGYRPCGHEGLPRFLKTRFRSGYPFGHVELTDPAVPLTIGITGWSPFVPAGRCGQRPAVVQWSNTRCAIPLGGTVDFEFSFPSRSPRAFRGWERGRDPQQKSCAARGIFFDNTLPAGAETSGSASLSVVGQTRPKIKAMWLRGAWFDAISALWSEVEGGRFTTNDGQADPGWGGRNGGSVLVSGRLAPGAETTIPVVLTWFFPNSNQRYGEAGAAGGPPANTSPSPAADEGGTPAWRPFYAGHFQDAAGVADHVHRHYESLRSRTLGFQRALLLHGRTQGSVGRRFG